MRRGGLRRTRAIWGVLFVSPLIIGLIVFAYGAVIAGLGISFTRYDTISPPQFVGIENFRYLVQWDLARIALRNTAYYTAGVIVLGLTSSLALSMALNQKIRGILVYRSVYFLPVISSMVGIALMWRWLYMTDFGLINWFLSLLGLPRVPWLTSKEWAMPAMIIMSVWKSVGYYAFLFLAALQGVPDVYYEAAKIDGASAWHRFTRITLPLISPTTFFVLVTMAIGSFQVFDQVYIMTKGGPSYSTLPLVLLIYRSGFENLDFGLASALAFVLFIVVLLLSVVQFRLQRYWVHYGV
jgi:multiple sugar transport system permease protein